MRIDRHDREPLRQGWLGLYIVHLLALIPTLAAMFFASGLLVALVTLIFNGHANWTAAEVAAYLVPLGFIAWATSGIVFPLGAGRWLASAVGARTPTSVETQAYKDAIEGLAIDETAVKLPKFVWVLDESDLNACVIADTIIINRELLDTGYLEAVIAHELGHLNSHDARLTVAVNRLAAFSRPAVALRERYGQRLAETGRVGCLAGLLILIVRACSGTLATLWMAPAWASWWRMREYAADDYAASLGQAEHLANLLETHGLLYDIPIPHIWTSTHTHPPVALRIDRLRQHPAA
jgi:Zn-dependent protease with chaperone function